MKSNNKFIILIIFSLYLASCMGVSNLYIRKGINSYKSGDYDGSIKYFEQAFKKNPDNKKLRTLLFKSKLSSYYLHLSLARKYKQENKKELAKREYEIVLKIFPDNRKIAEEYKNFIQGKKDIVKKRDIKASFSMPIELDINKSHKITINLKKVPITNIFKVLGKSYDINIVFDKDFRDFIYSYEVQNAGFYSVLNQLCLISGTKYRILDKKSVLIYQNNSYKKRTFDLKGIKTFILSNIKAEDAKKIIQMVYRNSQIYVQDDKGLNALIIMASYDILSSMDRFIQSIDIKKPEVELDVEILEVNRSLLRRLGSEYGPISIQPGDGSSDSTSINSVLNVNNLKSTNFYITLPSVAINMLTSDDDSKIIAKPNLRGINGEEIKFMVGDEIPVPQMTLGSAAAGGVATIPITNYEYKNVGVEIKLTPFIHKDNEVTIKIKLTLNFVSTYVEKFPVLGKREFETVIRLKEGETSIIGGFIKDENRKSLKGIPGISRIPILGKLFGSTEDSIKQTDLIFSITPKIIRNISNVSDEPIWFDLKQENNNMDNRRRGLKMRSIPMRRRVKKNSEKGILRLIPSKIKSRINETFKLGISLSPNSKEKIKSISISGYTGSNLKLLGYEQLSELKDVGVLKSINDNSFDLGFSFEKGNSSSNLNLGNLTLKALKKGIGEIIISKAIVYTISNKVIDLDISNARVEIK